MKIAFISSLYPPNVLGGAERVVQLLAEGLVLRGHNCAVVTLAGGREHVRRSLNGVEIHELPLFNCYNAFKPAKANLAQKTLWHGLDSFNLVMAHRVGLLLDEVRPDIVNTHNIGGFSVAVWREVAKRKVPLAHVLHDQYLLCPTTTMHKDGSNCKAQCTACRLFSAPRLLASNCPNAVIGVSRFIVERHRQFGFFRDVPASVIYNGLTLAGRDRTSTESVRQGPVRFGFLGRVHPTKGVEDLLRAFIRLPESTAKLVIAGKGAADYESYLRSISYRNSNVEWAGFVKPQEFLGTVDALVIPSLWHDTAPLVALEGMAFGLPIIAARRGGLTELVTDDVGWTYDPDDASALYDTFITCVGNRRELAVRGAAGKVRSRSYTLDLMLDGYERQFEQMIGRVPARQSRG